ncbi:MAG: PAS domain-containing sensor histidine kinase, partial [Rhodospirillales bacterium]|nr:PAS domain-containing sensor histidine kinase [Rhodospirillales bacterium]
SSESVSSIERFFPHIHPDDIDEARTIWARARDGEKEVQIQLRVVWPDGSEHWLFSRGERAFNSSRDIMTMRGVIMDITDLKQGEQALRDSEEWFRTLAEALPEIVWSASPEGNTIYSNARWTEYTGLPRDAALDGQWRNIIHCDDLPRTLEAWKAACMARKPYQIEHRFRHRSGYYHWFLTRAMPVKDTAGRVMKWYGTATDIDDQKRAEQELSDHSERLEELVRQRTVELEASHQRLRLSDRMAALGTLSAGLGHDMGNLLLPLRVRLDSLEARGLTPELHEDVAAMRKSAEYLQRLTNGLRLLALDPEDAGAAGEEVCLRDWWADVEALLRNTLPRTVALTYAVAPETPPVRLARHRLTQAVFNLVQNAGEAMRERGHGTVRIWAKPEGAESVVLSIADNGPGMTPEVRRRCIEPFFTTKTRGLSTGLGLALVNGIVQASGGWLAIDTAPGMGTTFHLGLPAAIRAVRRVRPLAVVSLTDARMRSFVASVLRGLEYDVATGDQAAPGPPTQLWVTDGDQICGEYLERFTREGGGRVVLFGECRVEPRGI